MNLSGINIVVSEFCMVSEWEFPKDKFVEYDKSDEWWARKYGFGWLGPEKPGCYIMQNPMDSGREIIVMHPEIHAAFQKRLSEAADKACDAIMEKAASMIPDPFYPGDGW